MGGFIQPFCVEDRCSNNMIEIEISSRTVTSSTDIHKADVKYVRSITSSSDAFPSARRKVSAYNSDVSSSTTSETSSRDFQQEEKFQLTIQTFHHQQLQKQVQEIFSKKKSFSLQFRRFIINNFRNKYKRFLARRKVSAYNSDVSSSTTSETSTRDF